MPDSTIHVAPPEEKLMLRAKQAREFGKEFDEVKERAVINRLQSLAGKPLLPPLEREPIIIAANELRDKMIRSEDARGLRELEAEAKKASDEDMRRQIEIQQSELEKLRRQVAELSGGAVTEAPDPVAAIPPPSAETEEAAEPDGDMPDDTWSHKQIREWTHRQELPSLPRDGVGFSKSAVLDHALTEYQRRESASVTASHGRMPVEMAG